MANEFWHNFTTGLTLYAITAAVNGQVYLTAGTGPETYGTGGRDADDYDVDMTETAAGSRHYLGTFNVTAEGTYRITVYEQAGANPADSDSAVAQGEFYWDGSNEITLPTINADQQTTLFEYEEPVQDGTVLDISNA